MWYVSPLPPSAYILSKLENEVMGADIFIKGVH